MKLLVIGCAVLCATASYAKAPKPAISLEAAQKTALARVSGGVVRSSELEKEHGRLIYSFDVADKEKRLIEVHVDANSGEVVTVEEESPEKERQEARHDGARR